MIKPIRVLQVLHILNRGGAEAMVMNLYRKVDRTKVQFDFLVHEPQKGLFEDEITAMGGRIYRVQAFKGYNVCSYLKECRKFFRAHPEIKVVHGHLGSCATYYLKAAKECGIYIIAHSHSAGGIRNFHDVVYKFFSYPTRFIADSLFGCSTEAGIARYGVAKVKSDRYRNFNNGIDINNFAFTQEDRDIVRQELGVKDNEYLIGNVGRVTIQKNPHRLILLFISLVNEHKDVKCVWVGTGELMDECKRQIKEAGMEDRIIMTGVRSDIPRVMKALDCLLFPSLWEGLPVSVIEAQAANLPVVLSDTISKEVQISDLTEWHSLNEDDSTWCEAAYNAAKSHFNKRENYSFDMKATGYDINETVRDLTEFYLQKAK